MFGHEQQEQIRAATIEVFHRYLRARAELVRTTGVGDNASDDDIKLLSKDVEYLAAGRYLLAVVGEAKSGKSTFINALLRRQLLPTDVLQCTSGIIEIIDTKHRPDGRKVFLSVRYGRAPEPQLEYEHPTSEDIGPLRDRLAAVAAVREEYRPLPVHQLNEQLVADHPAEITHEYVASLLVMRDESGKEVFENPHRLPAAAFARLVQKYLEEYRDLTQIAVDITVGYPLGFGYSDLRIVDTPGVNARGGLKDATLKYMLDANAVVLLHPVGNIASESLETFFRRHVPDQAKKNTFLFLTHVWPMTRDRIATMLAEARRLYPETEIQPGRIVAIDSMLKQIANQIDTERSVSELRRDETVKPFLARYVLDLGEDAARVRQALARDSNFDVAEDLIREFAGQAFANHVRAILDRISDAYREQGVVYSERIHLLKSKVTRPPEDFTSEIQELKVLLARYQEILGSFSWTVRDQFAGLSETNELFAQIQKRFTNALNNALTIDELRKHLIDFNKECGDRLNERITALRVQYECKMEEVGQAYQAKHAITAPKIRMDAIAKQAEERAYDVITIPGDRKIRAAKGGVIGGILGGIGGFLLGGPIGAALGAALVGGATAGGEYLDGSPDRTQKIRNERKHFEAFRDGCIDDVAWLTDAMVLAVGSSADAYAKEFNAKMSVVVEQRTDAYDLLISQRSEAEVLREEIRFLETHDESTGRERIAIKDLTATL